jgi:osmotically-inducible protein OsmY
MHRIDIRDAFVPWLNVTAALAAGALLAWAIAEAAQRMRRLPGPLSDDIVAERVRDRVFEVVSRPENVQVTVENGVVRLSGELPADERDELLTQLVYMPGVVRLRNKLAALS